MCFINSYQDLEKRVFVDKYLVVTMTTGPDSCVDNFDEEWVPFEPIACASEHN